VSSAQRTDANYIIFARNLGCKIMQSLITNIMKFNITVTETIITQNLIFIDLHIVVIISRNNHQDATLK